MRQWNRTGVTTETTPLLLMPAARAAKDHKTSTLCAPHSSVKKLLPLAETFSAGPSTLFQATQNSHQVRSRLPPAQNTTSHGSRCPGKNRVHCHTSKKISHSLQQLNPKLSQVRRHARSTKELHTHLTSWPSCISAFCNCLLHCAPCSE